MVLQPRGCGRVGRRRTYIGRGAATRRPLFPFTRTFVDVLRETRPGSVHNRVVSAPVHRRRARPRPVSVAGPSLGAGGDVHVCTGNDRPRPAARRRQRRPPGGSGVRDPRGGGAAQRGRVVLVPGRDRHDRRATSPGSASMPSSAPRGCLGSGARLGWQPGDVVEVEGAIRRRFFRAGGGAASRVEVEVSSGSTGAACSERMSTPRLGLGWKDVAFSGSSRPPVDRRVRRRRSPAQAAAPTGGRTRQCQGLLDAVVVRHLRGRQGRDEVPVEPLDRQQPPVRGRRSPPRRRRRSRSGSRGPGRRAPYRPRRLLVVAPAARAAASRSSSRLRAACGGWPRGTARCLPGRPAWPVRCPSAVPGCCLLEPQVGGVPVMAVGDERGRPRRAASLTRATSAGVVDAPQPLLLPRPVACRRGTAGA